MDRRLLLGIIFVADLILLWLLAMYTTREQFLGWYMAKNMLCYAAVLKVSNKKIAGREPLPLSCRLCLNLFPLLMLVH